jgi:hypothetical protein
MDRQQFSWLIVRAFGVYLLIQAFMVGLGIVGELYTARILGTLASGTKNDYIAALLLSYRSSMLSWLVKFVLYSAAGIYFLRGGRLVMRLLQHVPGNRTPTVGDDDAQQIVGRERRERLSQLDSSGDA